MVEVTQHGEAFHQGVCKRCHCEFNFCLSDINYDKNDSEYPFYFSCPECGGIYKGDTAKVVTFMLEKNYRLNYQPSPF